MTITATRIRKNAGRTLRHIAARVHRIKVYNLDNGFRGQTSRVQDMWCIQRAGSVLAWLSKSLSGGYKLYATGEGTYRLRVHSDLWFDLLTGDPTERSST